MNSVTERRGTTYSGEAAGKSGKLRCHVVCRRLADDSQAHYSMLLCNESSAVAHVSAFVPQTRETHYRTVMQTSIAPRSDLSTTIALELAPTGAMPEIHVALTNGEIQLLLAVSNHAADRAPVDLPRVHPIASRPARVAAPPESAERTFTRASPAVTPILLAFVAMLVIVAGFAFRPRIAGLALPPIVPAGTDVAVSYQTLGLGVSDYTVLGSDGQTVAAGSLPSGGGRFVLTLPPASTTKTYLVRTRIANLLGSATREAYVRVPAVLAVSATPRLPRPRHARASAAPPMIRSIALDRATLSSGETLNVSYDVLAATGSLALVDPALQITYGKAQLGSSGHASFVAPQTDTPRFLTVIITAARGTATTQSRISVTVTPRATPAPQGEAISAGAPDTNTTSNEQAFPIPGIAVPAMVHSRQPIRVEVHGAGVGMQLVLLGGNGSELARRNALTGSSRLDFVAPAVRARTRLILEAIYPNSTAGEPIVRTILIAP